MARLVYFFVFFLSLFLWFLPLALAPATSSTSVDLHLGAPSQRMAPPLQTTEQPLLRDPPRQTPSPPHAHLLKKALRHVAAGVLSGALALAPATAAPPPPPPAYIAPLPPPRLPFLPQPSVWRYSDFLSALREGRVRAVQFDALPPPTGDAFRFFLVDGAQGHVQLPYDDILIEELLAREVDIFTEDLLPYKVLVMSIRLAATSLIVVACVGVARESLGRIPTYLAIRPVMDTGVTFADVAGVDPAKVELQEVVDFLRHPAKYTALGARIPRGALLAGPPGTGKTLLARAVAGEAGVPFFSISSSQFIEVVAGGGASRIRDVFAKARRRAPCIIFLDELDAIGRHRGAGSSAATRGGGGEREQTINQLLIEMDGYSGDSGVLVLAATNRLDVLDAALLRPGRFDRRIVVDLPDLPGRLQVLEVHRRGKPLAADVDLEWVARRCVGFSGADLQNLLNEAALMAVRRGLSTIGQAEVSDALDRILMGPEKPPTAISPATRRLLAYHEAGHALLGALLPGAEPPARVSLVQRAGAKASPTAGRLRDGLYTRASLETSLCVALGGRAAEELCGAGNASTAAAEDLQEVTRIAQLMVTQMGFSDRLGLVALATADPVPRGMPGSQLVPMSRATACEVDEEVQRLVDEAYQRAQAVLRLHDKALHAVAAALEARESLRREELQALLADHPPDGPPAPLA